MSVEHRVGLNKSSILKVALTHPEGAGVLLTTTGTALHRTRIHRILTTVIGLIHVLHQRITHTRHLQGLREQGENRVLRNLVGQHQTTRRDGVVQHMHHTIGHRVIALNDTRILIDIIDNLIIVVHVRIT